MFGDTLLFVKNDSTVLVIIISVLVLFLSLRLVSPKKKMDPEGTTFVPPRTTLADAQENEIGIAHAGGHFRAIASSIGALRGFEQKGVMKKVKYNSGISGGSIPAILYTYAGIKTEDLLETHRSPDPSKITLELLEEMPKTSMGYVITGKENARRTIIFSLIKSLLNPINYFKCHSFWTAGVFNKLSDDMVIPVDKFFTSSEQELEKILKDNPQLNKEDFILPREDVTTLPMILYTMHGPRADFSAYEKNFRKIYDEAFLKFNNSTAQKSQMTDILLDIRDKHGSNLPMPYVATPECVENKYNGHVQLRNKKIAFPESNARPFEWGAEKGTFGRGSRFSLEFLTSMSTNFPGSASVTLTFAARLFAMFITSLRRLSLDDKSDTTLRFADGGTSDVAGIIPLVARGTKNIICLWNFNQNPPVTDFTKTYADTYNAVKDIEGEDEKFQEWLKHLDPRISSYFGHFETPIEHANIMNHIFDDPDLDSLKELMNKFNSLFEAGEPLVVTLKDLKIIDNPFWGINCDGKKTIDLTFMYFNMPKKFSEQMSNLDEIFAIDDDGRFKHEEYRVVPELKVDGTEAFKYSARQVNMTGYLGSWIVHHSWNGLKGKDGKIHFEGFEQIFKDD